MTGGQPAFDPDPTAAPVRTTARADLERQLHALSNEVARSELAALEQKPRRLVEIGLFEADPDSGVEPKQGHNPAHHHEPDSLAVNQNAASGEALWCRTCGRTIEYAGDGPDGRAKFRLIPRKGT
jgi:hypothetical protein